MARSSLVLLGLLLFASAVEAANPKVQALIKEGERLYKENKYREAGEALKQAYDLEPASVLLYNIGRAYDQAGELKLALDYYRQFVGQEGSDPALVKKANLAMDRLRTLVARDEAGRQVNEAEKKRLEDEARIAKEKATEEAEKARVQKEAYEAKEKAAREASQKSTSGRLVGGLAVAGVAVAALGSGLAFGLLARESKSGFDRASSVAEKKRLQEETTTRSLIADVSFGTAIVAAVVAVIVFPKGGSAEAPKQVLSPVEGPAVQMVFGPSEGGAFAGLRGHF